MNSHKTPENSPEQYSEVDPYGELISMAVRVETILCFAGWLVVRLHAAKSAHKRCTMWCNGPWSIVLCSVTDSTL